VEWAWSSELQLVMVDSMAKVETVRGVSCREMGGSLLD